MPPDRNASSLSPSASTVPPQLPVQLVPRDSYPPLEVLTASPATSITVSSASRTTSARPVPLALVWDPTPSPASAAMWPTASPATPKTHAITAWRASLPTSGAVSRADWSDVCSASRTTSASPAKTSTTLTHQDSACSASSTVVRPARVPTSVEPASRVSQSVIRVPAWPVESISAPSASSTTSARTATLALPSPPTSRPVSAATSTTALVVRLEKISVMAVPQDSVSIPLEPLVVISARLPTVKVAMLLVNVLNVTLDSSWLDSTIVLVAIL